MGISDNDVLQAKSRNVVSSGSSPRSEWKSDSVQDGGGAEHKFKQRRVSGLREYPAGCGPPIDSMPGKLEVSSVNGTNSAGLEKENSDVDGIGGTRIQSDHLTAPPPSMDTTNLDDAGVLDVKYPPKRRVSGVRDFPENCGRNAESFSKVEKGKDPTMNVGDHQREFGRDVLEKRSYKVAARKSSVKLYVPNYDGHKVAAEKGLALDFKSSSRFSLTKGVMASGSRNFLINGRQRKPEQRKPLAKSKVATIRVRRNIVRTEKTDVAMHKVAERNGPDDADDDDKCNDYLSVTRRIDSSVNPDPSGPSILNGFNSHRKKVSELLREFHKICRKSEGHVKRVDCFAFGQLKNRGMCLNQGIPIIGAIPGVEVGDEFQYRLEFNLIGLHRPPVAGIDSVRQGNITIAVSVVASGGYNDNLDESDVLDYTGQGGQKTRTKEAEDQKLENNNLALKNSIKEKNPVRVIRGDVSDSADAKGKIYVYDGLYTVESYKQEQGPNGYLVFRFHMVRIPGQPELTWKQVRKFKKSKVRVGLKVTDISRGKELTPICAVNTVDDEQPPPFKYITEMIYPNHPTRPNGCGCRSGCSQSSGCSCLGRNGGEFPYNHSGAIVEVKDLVYECGISCKCPPSCYNRVTQKGIRFQLEIFKTGSRGWGVRSLNSIASGSFICEYIGELLEDNEAERRTNDEYLFDIGRRRDNGEPDDAQSSDQKAVQDSNFTIDAAKYGNVGRFINHSCTPNLYAQNMLFGHGDPKIPHIMLFALENIPPLRELTYNYNYQLHTVHDSHGNIKKKSCYCGSAECRGRMY